MEILLTGNTCFVTPAWVEMAFPEDHVLITCARGQPHPPRIRTITLDSKERIGQLVDSYEFDRIVYFSEYLTPHSEQEGELDRLRRVLQANRERPSQLLYLAGPEAVLTPFIGKSVLAKAAEALCRHYAETSRVQIKVLHLPYLYGTDCTGAPVGIAQLLTRPKSGELHFEEQALAPVAALCMEDLSELVLRVFDNWTPEWENLTAPVVFHWNYEQLGEAWKALCPGLTVTYGSDLVREYPPDDGQLRRAYGWFPRYDLLDDLPRFFRQEKQPRRKKWPERLSGFAARHRLLVPVLELLGAWGVSELLVRMTSTQAQFRVVDFRLAFIVLIADVYGLNAGVAAAFLASLSLAAGYWAEGASPLLLFYEPSNWLAFLVYFVVGAVCGYVQLRRGPPLCRGGAETAGRAAAVRAAAVSGYIGGQALVPEADPGPERQLRQGVCRDQSTGRGPGAGAAPEDRGGAGRCARKSQRGGLPRGRPAASGPAGRLQRGLCRPLPAIVGRHGPWPGAAWHRAGRAVGEPGTDARPAHVRRGRAGKRGAAGADPAARCGRGAAVALLPEHVPHPLRAGRNGHGAGRNEARSKAGGAGMRRNGLHTDLVEKLRVDDELHRSIRVEDRAGTAATVPLEEALILDTAEQRRKLILSVLTEDPVQYYDLLQQARMNDDSEVVHYAATAMAQISKQADLALQQDARRFADDPNDREVLAAYANALERSLKLGLAQGRAAELQRRQLERLLKLQLADSPREEGYSLGCRLAEVQLQLQEYKAAEQTLEELVRRWPVRETPWLLRLRSAAARKSGAEVRSILQEVERTQVYLSAAGRQELAFWKGGAA